MAQTRWKFSPPNSNWGEFGPDDQLGRLNLITPEKVKQGIAEVREGKAFCLSLPLDVPGEQTLNPRRMPPQRFGTLRDGVSAGQQGFCWSFENENPELTDVVCDDVVLMNTQYSTQWDSLAHVGSRFDADGDGVAEKVFYNGFRAGVDIVPALHDPSAKEAYAQYPNPVANALSIDNLATHGLQGRGVMVDLEAHFGRQHVAVGYDALMRILETDKVEIESGDMVCLNTGYADTLLAMNRKPDLKKLHDTGSGLDGWDQRLLKWIVDSKLACLISDNLAVELMDPKPALSTVPSDNGARLSLNRRPRLPLHEHCLFKNGIVLGELWYLTDLARWLRSAGRNRFLLTAPPLRLPGAVGSPATPIATV